MMSGIYRSLLLVFLVAGELCLLSQPINRRWISLENDWLFQKVDEANKTTPQSVQVPHTWNALDAQQGVPYWRGEGRYTYQFLSEDIWRYKRVFIHFEGVMSSAKVYLNDQLLGSHEGGYSAFSFELTPHINLGGQNRLEVLVSNAETEHILPLVGDFNLYGGIYRPVKLLVTDRVCVSPLDYASSGIYLHPKQVSRARAEVEVEVKLSQGFAQRLPIGMRTTLRDQAGNSLFSEVLPLFLKSGDTTVVQSVVIDTPHLWNGRMDPYLYTVTVDIFRDYRRVDRVSESLGLRTYKVDPSTGFSLNGKKLVLQGVSRHQDRQDKGSALDWGDHKQDMELMEEMGVNAIRLAHYQQSKDIYTLADSAGMVVWAEIPWVGLPNFLGRGTNGYESTAAFHQNARQQLIELIRQNYNHPSICFWGIFNEIQNPEEASPVPFIRELDSLAKAEDPYRISTGASMLDAEEPIHDITNIIAWNKYFGWYYFQPEKVGEWLDEVHTAHPDWSIGISEYGAGASIRQHTEELERPNPFGSPHPEEWQCYYHEKHLEAFLARPYLWGTFVWNMFDFSSHMRREGDQAGINDKGLVTFDRKVKKDAFFLYKANWQEEPVLYIAGRRFIFRESDKTRVKVYSNLNKVQLSINGQELGEKKPEMGVLVWEKVPLEKGENHIRVEGTQEGKRYSDEVIWVKETGFGFHTLGRVFDGLRYLFPMLWVLAAGMLIAARQGFRRVKGYESRRRSRWRKRIWKILFFVFLILLIVLSALYIYLKQIGFIG